MALDDTAKESYMKDSIKKFFVDNLFRIEGLKLTFDKSLSVPRIQGNVPADRWVTVDFGELERGTLTEFNIRVLCCTRQDKEAYRLAQLTDIVMGYLTDTSTTDGMKRITFYKSKQSGSWEELGAFLVKEIMESGVLNAPDETKYKILSVQLVTASKI